jgi:hypothetical protein
MRERREPISVEHIGGRWAKDRDADGCPWRPGAEGLRQVGNLSSRTSQAQSIVMQHARNMSSHG